MNEVIFHPIYRLAPDRFAPQRFDLNLLPMQITENVTLEDVGQLLPKDSFSTWKGLVGETNYDRLESIRYALVQRIGYRGGSFGVDSEPSEQVEELMACLRLIRPMREQLGLFRGRLRNDGSIEVVSFSAPYAVHEVPEVEKLFAVTTEDAIRLRKIAGQFLDIRKKKWWKLIMAVEFFQAGFFQTNYWKARYALRCSAIEAVFGSSKLRNSRLTKARILKFLGSDTRIYEVGDLPLSVSDAPEITIGSVLEDLFQVRHCIAHGDRIPDSYSTSIKRQGVRGPLPLMAVLDEAASVIARRGILKVLEDNAGPHFEDTDAADRFFSNL